MRYALVQSSGGILGSTKVVGEANVSRRDDLIYFVALLSNGALKVRGYAQLDDTATRAYSSSTVSARFNGAEFMAWGFSEKDADGSHQCFAESEFNDQSFGVRAYRSP